MFGLFNKSPAPNLMTKASRALRTHFLGLREASWMGQNYRSYAHEAYTINVIAHSAINRIANSIASIEWMVRTADGQLLEDHPMIDLINRPNPIMSKFAWWRARVSYLLLSGNNYDEKVSGDGGMAAELWPLRPDRMSIRPGPSGIPAAFIYKVQHEKVLFPVDAIKGRSDILHIKLFSPLDDWYGQSAVSAAAYSVDQHNEAMNWTQSLLQNAARPSGVLTMGDDTNLSDEEYYRLKAEIDEQYTGSSNSGRPILLEGGMEWKSMGLSPMDMEILKTKESAARDISLAFGVPPLLLNIPGDNTYANYREARLGFYEDTVLPFVEYQAAELSHWLGEEFGDVALVPNKDKIEAIADKRMKMWEMADNSDDLTLNESRQIKGYDPLPAPLGNMLMSEIRKGKEDRPEEEEQAVEEQLKELGYGKADRKFA